MTNTQSAEQRGKDRILVNFLFCFLNTTQCPGLKNASAPHPQKTIYWQPLCFPKTHMYLNYSKRDAIMHACCLTVSFLALSSSLSPEVDDAHHYVKWNTSPTAAEPLWMWTCADIRRRQEKWGDHEWETGLSHPHLFFLFFFFFTCMRGSVYIFQNSIKLSLHKHEVRKSFKDSQHIVIKNWNFSDQWSSTACNVDKNVLACWYFNNNNNIYANTSSKTCK